MFIQLNYFHDSVNTVAILAPSREILSAKCVQFFFKFTK